jgi:outer membrane biosynthesis protein TonB
VYLNTGPLDTPCRYLVEESVPDGWTIDGPARLEFMPLGADKIKTAQFMNRFSGSPAVTASSTPNTTAPRVTATSKPVPRTTAPPVETTQPEEPTVAPTSPPRTAPQSTGPAKTAPPATQSSEVSTTEPVQTTTAEVTLVDVSTTTAAAAAPTSTAATRDSQAVAPSADSSNSINGGLVALGAAGAAALFGSLIIGWRRRNADDELDSNLYDGDLYE